MAKLTEKELLNHKFYSCWVNGEEKGNVITTTAKSTLETQKVPIAGSLGKLPMITGAEGAGSLSFYKIIDDSIVKDINDCIKNGVPFVFDLIGEVENKSTGGTYRVVIEDCYITSFNVIDVDISSTDALKESFDFEYNPANVVIE